MQTLIVAVVAGTLFLRGTLPSNSIQGGTLYLGLIFLSIVSSNCLRFGKLATLVGLAQWVAAQ